MKRFEPYILPAAPPETTICFRNQSILPVVVKLLLTAELTLVFTGCSLVGPDYTPPDADAPDQWRTGLEDGLNNGTTTPAELADWWTALGDPLLDSLEQRGIAANLSLKEAAARVKEARALRGISQAALFPVADTVASMSSNRSSAASGTGKERELYAAGFDAGWEIDIFGGRRRAIEAAQAGLEAEIASLHDILVSLTAEIGLNYIEIRTTQTRLAAARANLVTQQQTYELNQSRYEAGLIDELAVQQSLYNLENTRSQIPLLQTGLTAARNRLAVLLGQKPGTLDKELAEKKQIPVPPLALAVGVPADTLRQRPDIRRAERLLAASTAGIGVAKADLYPKLRLLGSIGLESLALENLPEWASRTWSVGPSLSWRIFDAGAIRRNIQVQNARQEQALVNYEAAVLNALEEVENGLTSYLQEQSRRDALKRAVDAASQAQVLAQDRYKAGLVNFNTVLEAQRSLLSFEDELAQSEGAVTAGLIRLYKAMGGGWQSQANTNEAVSDTGK